MKKVFHTYRGKEGGYAVMTALLFFVASTAAVVASLSDGALREVRIVRNESFSKQSYYASESAAEDVAYRIKNSLSVGVTETLTLASSSASVSITNNPDGTKTVRSDGDAGGTKRTTEMILNQGTGVSFPYAIQSGLGGIDILGGSSVVGDIYTLGSIRGCGTCTVSGMAVAAGKSSISLNQENATPATPTDAILFGNTSSSQDFAQSFTVSNALSLLKIELYIKKVGNPANETIRITTDNGGRPSSTVLASGTLSSSLVSSSYGWVEVTLTANPLLSTETIYWIVVDGNHNSSNHYSIGANSAFINGEAKVGRYNSTWNNTSPSGLDGYFRVYIGTNEEGISGENENNKLSVVSAYSYASSYVSASGSLYCQTGIGNNKACDTSRGDPALESASVSDSTIDGWKNEASVSVYNGNYSVGSAGATLGPRKINGNLSVAGGGVLTISGTVWVTGSITIDGGSTVMLSDNTRSYAVIADGSITLSGGSSILGNTGSHVLLVSTSSADPAVIINGDANDTVVFVSNGGLSVSGGAHVRAASANHISIDGGSSIVYDPDVAMLNIPSDTSGEVFNIKSWKEVE